MSNKVVVWFNKHLSSLYDIVVDIKSKTNDYHFICSHTDATAPIQLVADEFFVEPVFEDNSFQKYLEFSLNYCKEHNVKYFIPLRFDDKLSFHIDKFSKIGTKLIIRSSHEVLNILDNKNDTFISLGDKEYVSEYKIARSKDEFLMHYHDMKTRYETICFKPTVGIYGYGFRIIKESENDFIDMLNGNLLHVSLELLQDMWKKNDQWQEIILMPYYDKNERSVDCFCNDGELIDFMSRNKLNDRFQVLEQPENIKNYCKDLIKHFNLSGWVNIQFKDLNGQPYLLEINPRFSGGIYYSFLSGNNIVKNGLDFYEGKQSNFKLEKDIMITVRNQAYIFKGD